MITFREWLTQKFKEDGAVNPMNVDQQIANAAVTATQPSNPASANKIYAANVVASRVSPPMAAALQQALNKKYPITTNPNQKPNPNNNPANNINTNPSTITPSFVSNPISPSIGAGS